MQLRTKWDEINSKIPKNKIWDYEPKVTDGELRNVIKSITKDTTSGPDKVVYSDLKILAESKHMFNDLLEVVNATLEEGTIPFDGRDYNLSVLPKPNEDHRILKGYRIITMANIIVKLCKKIAAKRVTNQLKRESKLPEQVGGAGPMRSTTSKVEALVYRMQAGLQGKKAFCPWALQP